MLWTPADNGLFELTNVAQNPEATERGGEMLVNPATLETFTKPWDDASGDLVTMRVLPPDGVSLGTPEETEYGWTVPMSNGWVAEVTSLYETRWMAYLANFLAPGVKTLFWIPVGDVVDSGDGWWRPKRIEIAMRGDFEICVQPGSLAEARALCPLIADEQDLFVYGSAALYSKYKCNNGPFGNYTTGKVGHLPAPAAIFWKEGRFLGRVTGRLELVGPGLIDKAFPMSAMSHYLQSADMVSIDATHGYTGVGSFAAQNWPGHFISGGVLPAGAWEITSFSALSNNAHAAQDYWAAAYTVTNSPGSDYPNALIPGSVTPKQAVQGYPSWTTFALTTPAKVAGGIAVGTAIQGSNSNGYEMRGDLNISGYFTEWANYWSYFWTYGADPAPTNSLSNGPFRIAAYFTYNVAVSAYSLYARRRGISPIGVTGVRVH